jgi:hypothetical protein
MTTVNYTLDIGTALTSEEDAAMGAEIASAMARPRVYDSDCPPLTAAELAEFQPAYRTQSDRELVLA